MLNSKGERMLAYVTIVDEIKPIPNYDRVEYARTNGWWVVINKQDNLQVGDKCVYFEVDSRVNSDDKRFAFLEKHNYKIKTQKMCKVVSQGLLMPLSLFPEIKDDSINADVTDLLGVIHVDNEEDMRKQQDLKNKNKAMTAKHSRIFKKCWAKWLMRRAWGRRTMFFLFGKNKDEVLRFPNQFPFIHKTNEERCENLSNVVLGYKNPLIVTEKLDGTSSTFILERVKKRKFRFYVVSRNVQQTAVDQKNYHKTNVYWDMAIKYDIERRLKEYLESNSTLDYVCIQGEIVGSIQGNPLKLKEDNLYVFNFIRSDVGRVSSIDGEKIINKMGMKWVPILDTNYKMPTDMEEFKEFATAKSKINPNVLREGLVLRDPINDFSFKNISREYLLKHDK